MSDLESRIRDLINSPRKQYHLLGDRAAWHKLCSSLDVIGDTELALEAYSSGKWPDGTGEAYLILYGVLQVLFVQQDAVKHVAESLDLEYEPDPILRHIREVRNNSVGHPTKRGSGKGRSFNFLTRVLVRRSGFGLMTVYADGDYSITDVNVPDLIDSQRTILRKALTEVIEKLKEEEMNHRERFREDKLADAFPPTLGYYYQKVGETIDGLMPPSFGASVLDLIATAVEEFKKALEARGLTGVYDSVDYLLGLVAYPLDELREYFRTPQQSKLNSKDAGIFLFFVRNHIDQLIGIAREIDAEYDTDLARFTDPDHPNFWRSDDPASPAYEPKEQE